VLAADNSGRYGAEFMAGGGGARSLGMGGAYSAQAGDPFVLFWNPAGLHNTQRYTAGFQHSERFDGVIDYDVAVAAMPYGDNSVRSLGLIRLGVNGIPFTRLENPAQGPSQSNRIIVDKSVNSAEYAFFAGHTSVFRERFYWGIAPKLLFKHIGSNQAYGLGVDVGGHTRLFDPVPIDVGLAFSDLLGTPLLWDTGRKEVISPSARLGISVSVAIPPLDAVINPVADVTYRFENIGDDDAYTLNYGVEYLVKNVVGLRVGMNDKDITYGGGIVLNPLSIDYAYIGHDQLGATHRVSLTVRWGEITGE